MDLDKPYQQPYHIHGTILNLDRIKSLAECGLGDEKAKEVEDFINKNFVDKNKTLSLLTYPTPVFGGANYLIGYASLSFNKEKTAIEADFFISHQTPERLSLECGDSLYPHVASVWFENPLDRQGEIVLIVDSISLLFKKAPDERIGALEHDSGVIGDDV